MATYTALLSVWDNLYWVLIWRSWVPAIVNHDYQLDLESPRKTGLGACLWGIILIAFIEVGRPAHCRWPQSMTGISDYVDGQRASQYLAFICCLIRLWTQSPATLTFLPCWTGTVCQRTPLSLALVRLFYHSTRRRNYHASIQARNWTNFLLGHHRACVSIVTAQN